MEKLRVAMLGCGKITITRHAPEYFANPNVEITGFFDRSVSRAAEMVSLYEGRVYEAVEEVLNDPEVDAVN